MSVENPKYRGFGMTYEEYCVFYETEKMFGEPDDPSIWNNADNLRDHIVKLKESPISNYVLSVARTFQIANAEARLDYLINK